jgi:putative chitinase
MGWYGYTGAKVMDISNLKSMLPPDVFKALPDVIHVFEINNPYRLTHFLSQVSHESGGFVHTAENMNYSEAGLLAVFPSHFTPTQAKEYANKPECIANRAYANRMGNGDEASGDGWRYRGRGYIQITGKDLYERMAEDIDGAIIEKPECIADQYALASAGWWWLAEGCNKIADTRPTVKAMTRKVNGGLYGLADRQELYRAFSGSLGS